MKFSWKRYIYTRWKRYIYTRFYYFSLLDNDVLETSKRRVMLYNILSQIFIVKCFTKSFLIRILFNDGNNNNDG